MNDEYKRILAPIDGSDTSFLALKKAIRIAKNGDGKLIIAHALAFNFETYSESSYIYSLKEDMVVQAKNLLQEARQIALDEGLTQVETLLTDGPHKQQIAETIVKEHKIDLIVMGATGQNVLERMLLGSTTEYVLRHAKCDVVIVRPEVNREEK